MSTFDIVSEHGPWRLAGFVVAVAVFLLLHVARWPFVLIARVLWAAQVGLDHRITAAITTNTSESGKGEG